MPFHIIYAYQNTISFSEGACKTRLELIKAIAVKTLQDLKNKADDVYKDMNDWLGARFLKEIERFVISPVAQSLDKTLTYSFLDFDNTINVGESLCSSVLIVSY